MTPAEKIAFVATLAQRAKRPLGRTALMKLSYFLQALRDVPLGYSFSLYSYGPFDSDVLADLDAAESFGAVKSQVVFYPGGYGYQIEATSGAEKVIEKASATIDRYVDDIDWVIGRFAGLTSSQLELVSTIIFVYREAAKSKAKPSLDTLANRVLELKPHFSQETVRAQVERLFQQNLLN